MLKYNNYQVHLSELEAVIDEIGDVKHSCVVGVSQESDGNDFIFASVVKKLAVVICDRGLKTKYQKDLIKSIPLHQ